MKSCQNLHSLQISYWASNNQLTCITFAGLKIIIMDVEKDVISSSGQPVKTFRYATEAEVLSLMHPMRKVHCDSCSKEITNSIQFRCMECDDVDMCPDCFSRGIEIKGHKRTHDYTIIEKLNFPLFDPHWSAEEEIQFLESIAKYGYNNWADVADHLSQYQDHTLEDCRQHYTDIYLNSPTAPRPNFNSIINPSNEVPTPDFSLDKPIIGFDPSVNLEFIPCTTTESSLGLTANMAPSDKKGKGIYTAPLSGGSTTVIGYLPRRGDFDIEWDNDAELTLADLEFLPTDSPAETALKQRVVSIYNSKLDERARRKQFVLKRGLLDVKLQAVRDRRRTKEEKDIWQALRPLERFQSEQEHEQLIAALLEERKLRERLEKLIEWRSAGLTSFEQAAALDKERTLRSQSRNRNQSAASGSNASHVSHAVYSWSGPSALEAATNAANNPTSTSVPAAQQQQVPGGGAHSKSIRGNSNTNRSISNMAGWNLLSASEQELCEQLRLPPQQYLVIKRVLIRTSVELGSLSRQSTNKILHIDSGRANQLFDFFVGCSWIKPGDAATSGKEPILIGQVGGLITGGGGGGTTSSQTPQ